LQANVKPKRANQVPGLLHIPVLQMKLLASKLQRGSMLLVLVYTELVSAVRLYALPTFMPALVLLMVRGMMLRAHL
jgi:hypothetical protein